MRILHSNNSKNFKALIVVEQSIYHEKIYCNSQMASSCTQWEKLSPDEFQQLQDLASCKYFKK